MKWLRWDDALIAFLGGYLFGCFLRALPRVTLLTLLAAAWFVMRSRSRADEWDGGSLRK